MNKDARSEKDGVLTITREKMLEAAGKCSTAKDVFKTIWPEEFYEKWEMVPVRELSIRMGAGDHNTWVFDTAFGHYVWNIQHENVDMGLKSMEYKLEGGKFYRRKRT